jgi:hypothetical protein
LFSFAFFFTSTTVIIPLYYHMIFLKASLVFDMDDFQSVSFWTGRFCWWGRDFTVKIFCWLKILEQPVDIFCFVYSVIVNRMPVSNKLSSLVPVTLLLLVLFLVGGQHTEPQVFLLRRHLLRNKN